MANERHDSRSGPPPDRYGLPGVHYPTPNVEDLIIVEDAPMKEANYGPLLRGTPHPIHAAALLVSETPNKGNNIEKTVRRVYTNARNGQDAYNLSLKYVAEANDCPIFIRQSSLPRATYAPATKLSPLTAVVSIALTAGGSGFTGTPTVAITGGAGSGATATAQMQNGAVVALLLTNGGTGYTSNPALAITGGGGSGATGTAAIQPTTAVLTREESEPESESLNAVFVKVTRVYTTLPGPAITTKERTHGGGMIVTEKTLVLPSTIPGTVAGGTLSDKVAQRSTTEADRIREYLQDNAGNAAAGGIIYTSSERERETGVVIFTDHFLADEGYALPSTNPSAEQMQKNANNVGYTGNSYNPKLYVIEARTTPTDGPRIIAEIDYCQIPSDTVENAPLGFAFPAIFAWNREIFVPDDYPGRYPPPWPGNAANPEYYSLLPARQNTQAARRIRTYSLGITNRIPRTYVVSTPGAASRFFAGVMPLYNCIHAPIKVFEQIVSGLTTYTETVEDIPSSTPASYDPKSILVAEAREVQWRGGIYMQEVYLVSEGLDLSAFPNAATEGYYVIENPFAASNRGPLSAYIGDYVAGTGYSKLNQPSLAKQLIATTVGIGGQTTPAVTIAGRDENGLPVSETIAAKVTADAACVTVHQYSRLISVASLVTDTVVLGTELNPDFASLRFVAAAQEGEQVFVGLAGFETTYTFRAKPAALGDVRRSSSAAGCAGNLLNAVLGRGVDNPAPLAGLTARRDVSDSTVLDFFDTNPLANAGNPATAYTLSIPSVTETFTVDFAGQTPGTLNSKYLTTADATLSLYYWFSRVQAEQFTVSFAGQTTGALANKYLSVANTVPAKYYYWFDVDGAGVDPGRPETFTVTIIHIGAAGIANLYFYYNGFDYFWFNFAAGGSDPHPPGGGTGTAVPVTNAETAANIADALNTAAAGIATFTTNIVGAVVTFTAVNTSTRPDANTGSNPNAANVAVYLTIATTQQGGPDGTPVPVALTGGALPGALATAFVNAVVSSTSSTGYTAASNGGNLATVTGLLGGSVTAPTNGTSGLTLTVTAVGGEVGVDPAPGGTGAKVLVTDGDSVTTMAEAFRAVAAARFTATRLNGVVTCVNLATGARADASRGSTSLDIVTTAEGGHVFATVTGWQSGATGETLAALPMDKPVAFVPFSFQNDALSDTAPDNDSKGVVNLPATAVFYSDWQPLPGTPVAQNVFGLVFNATGSPAILAQYQVRANPDVSTWAPNVDTKAISMTLTNGSATWAISGSSYSSAYAHCSVLIAGDPLENEILTSGTLRRPYQGGTGVHAAVLDTSPNILVGNLQRASRVAIYIGTPAGYIRAKFTQPTANVKPRAVHAALYYAVAPQ